MAWEVSEGWCVEDLVRFLLLQAELQMDRRSIRHARETAERIGLGVYVAARQLQDPHRRQRLLYWYSRSP